MWNMNLIEGVDMYSECLGVLRISFRTRVLAFFVRLREALIDVLINVVPFIYAAMSSVNLNCLPKWWPGCTILMIRMICEYHGD